MDNFKIVFFLDIYLGFIVGRIKMEMFVRMVNMLELDVTVIVGDFCDLEVLIFRIVVVFLG